MELYRVTTYSQPENRDGKNYISRKRVEVLQRRHAVSTRIKDANEIAAYHFRQNEQADFFVLAEKLVDGEWIPIDCLTGPDRFLTCDQTYESMNEWKARHGK